MTGESILCFAKDWDDDPTCNTHVMRLLARSNRVLWLNSIGMRRPCMRSSRDLGRIFKRLPASFRAPRRVVDDLWVADPLILPLPHSRAATYFNRMILRATIGTYRKRLGMDTFQLWTFLPTAVKYVGRLGESLVVYYCTDDWQHAVGYEGERLHADERDLCARADVVFTTSGALRDRLGRMNPETHLALHGVDHAQFAAALRAETRIAPELAGLPRPILGLVGLIDERVDTALLERLAAAFPTGSLVLVGTTAIDLGDLSRRANVHVFGRQPYGRLPSFCKGFDVGLIPFVVNEYAKHLNPIKLREYLSAGLPVVSTDIPEVARYAPPLCVTVPTIEAFIEAVRISIEQDTPRARHERSNAMRFERWEDRVMQVSEQVVRVKGSTASAPPSRPAHRLRAPALEPFTADSGS